MLNLITGRVGKFVGVCLGCRFNLHYGIHISTTLTFAIPALEELSKEGEGR